MNQNLLMFLVVLFISTIGSSAFADIEVVMDSCTEKNSRGEFPAGGDCNHSGCWPAGSGCSHNGCWLVGGGCSHYGCWPAGGSCNHYGCTSTGKCTFNGCPNKISGEKIKYTCVNNAGPSFQEKGETWVGLMGRVRQTLEEGDAQKEQITLEVEKLLKKTACASQKHRCNMKGMEEFAHSAEGRDKTKWLEATRRIQEGCTQEANDCIARIH